MAVLELCLVFSLFYLFVYYFASQANRREKSKIQRIPGPLQFPILGNLPAIGIASLFKPVHDIFLDLNAKYGPLVMLQMGVMKIVVISESKTMKELLHSDDWIVRYSDAYTGERSFHKPIGVLFGVGEGWREIRRFTEKTLRIFGFGKHKSMETALAEELGELEIDLTSRIEKSGSEVCLKHFFNPSVLNILWTMVAGTRFPRDDPKLQRLVKLTDDIVRANPVLNLRVAVPFLRYFSPSFWGMRRMYKELHQFSKEVMEERRALGNFYREEPNDCIDVFLREIQNNQHIPNTFYTEEQFQTVIIDLIQAGSETTSAAIEFSLLCMVLHPLVQEKIQAEITAVTGDTRRPVFADQSQMPYTEATLLEIMRLASVAGIFFRTCVRDTEVNGFYFPKGTVAMLNTYSMHLNPQDWEDPRRFLPERFLDESGKVLRVNKSLPFGAGKRVCLGEQMSKVTIFTFLTTLLQSYTFAESEKHPASNCWLKFEEGFTLAPVAFKTNLVPRT